MFTFFFRARARARAAERNVHFFWACLEKVNMPILGQSEQITYARARHN